MIMATNPLTPGRENDTPEAEGENVQISQPRTERAEGPFEHSGETARWTKAEEAEAREQQDSGQQNRDGN